MYYDCHMHRYIPVIGICMGTYYDWHMHGYVL